MQSHVAANVRAEIARRGKTQGDIAAVLGFTRQSLSQRLLGRVEFRASELQAIADHLGVSIAELVEQPKASA